MSGLDPLGMVAPVVTMKYGRAVVGGTRQPTPDMNPASGTRSDCGERQISPERGVGGAGPFIPAGFRLTLRTSAHEPRERTHFDNGEEAGHVVVTETVVVLIRVTSEKINLMFFLKISIIYFTCVKMLQL